MLFGSATWTGEIENKVYRTSLSLRSSVNYFNTISSYMLT